MRSSQTAYCYTYRKAYAEGGTLCRPKITPAIAVWHALSGAEKTSADSKSQSIRKKRIPYKKDMRFLPPLYGLPLHRAESETDRQCFINVPHGFFVERSHFLAQAAFVQRADLLGEMIESLVSP